jgi:drug/metabolite transporter (DMT)-like permease
MNPARKKAYIALILCELIWGASQPLVKPALEFITPAQFIFLRYLIAAPFALPLIMRGFNRHKHSFSQLIRIIAIESVSVLNLFLLYTALTQIPALQSSLILQTRPIFIALAGLMILNETIERHEWLGLLFSVLGTFTILARPFFLHPDGFTSASFIGTTLLLITNLIYTGNILLIKKHYKRVSKTAISGIHMLVGLLLFGPYLMLTNNLPDMAVVFSTPSIVFPLVYMAILGSIVALTLSNFALSRIEASEATIFLYLQPLVYIPLSVLWLKEAITPAQLLGMTLILLGVVYSANRPKKKVLKHGLPLLERLRLAHHDAPHAHVPRA